MTMGYFWDTDDYKDKSDYEIGLMVLTKLYDELIDYWGRSTFQYSKEDFISYYHKLKGNQIAGLGLGIKFTEMPSSIVDEAIKKVVEKSNGRIPLSTQPLISAISQVAANSWMTTYSSDIVSSTVSDFTIMINRATEATLQTAEGIGWSSKLIMPASIVVGFAAILFFGKPYLKAAQKAFKK